MGKCDVCGRDNVEIHVCSSSCGPVSFAYCDRCLSAGYEPYRALTAMGLFWADINKTYKQQILIPSLSFHGKTREDFDNDVEKLYKEYVEAEQVAETNKTEVTASE